MIISVQNIKSPCPLPDYSASRFLLCHNQISGTSHRQGSVQLKERSESLSVLFAQIIWIIFEKETNIGSR